MQSADTALDMSELQRAAALVHAVMPPTPQYAWPKLKARAGCTVWVKHENHTPTGAFKVRGGLVYLDRLRRAQPEYARRDIRDARQSRSIHRIFRRPQRNSRDDLRAAQQFAAIRMPPCRLRRPPGRVRHRLRRSEARSVSRGGGGATAFHPVIPRRPRHRRRDLRSGTVPGGRRLGRGLRRGRHGLRNLRADRRTRSAGSQDGNHRRRRREAPATALSFAAGHPVNASSAKTFADGVATREPNAEAIARICRGASRMVRSAEDEIAQAMRAYFDDTHQVAEGAGAVPLAALLQERGAWRGKNVAVVSERRQHRAARGTSRC